MPARLYVLQCFVFILTIQPIFGSLNTIYNKSNNESEIEIDMITNVIRRNLENNGWNTFLFTGELPNRLFNNLKDLPMTFTITDPVLPDVKINNIVPYHSHTIIISFTDTLQFGNAVRKVTSLLYWHPLAHIILYYDGPYIKQVIAKIFFTLWYFKGFNVIILQWDLPRSNLIISAYNPYSNENFEMENMFGCWTTKRLGSPIKDLRKGFECTETCTNVSVHSPLRSKHLGTCVGFNSHYVARGDFKMLSKLVIFEDKARNLRGYTLRGFVINVPPFLKFQESSNGKLTLDARDGIIWKVFGNYLNCSLDLSPSKSALKKEFNYELNIQQLFAFSQRKADLLMFPVYQFDLIVAQVDYTFPFIDSGVCFITHRAGFEMIIFDAKLLRENSSIIFEYFICFLFTWLVFFLFNSNSLRKINFDQVGKDLMNTCKLILSISIKHEPKRRSFRIFLAIAIWSFYVINFSTQAAIISLFSAYKRGKNIDTFEEIIENLRNNKSQIEGIPSPDVTMPGADERVNIITSKLIPKQDIFDCIGNVKNDSSRICLTDCTVGRYLERSIINEKGQQYLHVAQKDRIHSLYLNMLFQKHSPLTKHYNKYIMALFEAGIIRKWMEYKYRDLKDEIPLKVLGMDDLAGIFQIYCILVGLSFFVFIIEVGLGFVRRYQ